jgi:diguanylate cyclase (GGDEF)-like protein/PAS domain S-box-containing protein
MLGEHYDPDIDLDRKNAQPSVILVADDDPVIPLMVNKVLSTRGMTVLAVADGLAAIEAFRQAPPDLALLDVHMPGADGYETCARMRELGGEDTCPIIIMTASDDAASVQRAFAAGASDFLTKPISWTLLPHRIRFVLRAADAARRLRESLRRSEILFARSAEGILIVDMASRRCVDANPALCMMLGYSRDEMRTLEWHDLQPPELYPANLEQFARCASIESGRLEGALMRRKDGVLFHADITHNLIDIDGRRCLAGFLVDVTEKRLADEALMRRASHDALTGLPNRALLLERLAQALKQAQRRMARVGLLFIDLDYFKEVNDAHGHAVGDLLLKQVAERLQGELRGEDTVARLGGDEFVVLMPLLDNEPQPCTQLAARIVGVLGMAFEVSGHTLHIGASIGIALYPDDAGSAAGLLDSADEAMYDAKRAGRGQYRRYRSS